MPCRAVVSFTIARCAVLGIFGGLFLPGTEASRASGSGVRCFSGERDFSVATYNVENFWDDDVGNSPFPYPTYSSERSNWFADGMAQKKAAQITRALSLAGAPDVVALQEIESAGNTSRSLEILKPHVESLGYRHFALGQQGENDATSVTTAVISKYPIASNERLDFVFAEDLAQRDPRDDEETDEVDTDAVSTKASSARDPQVVEVDLPGSRLRLYTSHWKSRVFDSPRSAAMRSFVARLIHEDVQRVLAIDPERDIVVTGDFNSEHTEPAMQRDLSVRTSREELQRADTPAALYNLWFELPVDKRCSYFNGGRRHCLDHILTSRGLLNPSGLSFTESGFRVVGHDDPVTAELLNRNGNPRRWKVRREKMTDGRSYVWHQGEGFSDHLPLVAKFRLKPVGCDSAK